MRDDGFLIEVLLVGVLILLNGFFAGAEIAVVSARRIRVAALAREGDGRASALLRLKDDPDRFLATVQVGITLVGTLASAVGGVAAVERFEPLIEALPLPWLRAIAEPIAVGAVVFAIAYFSLVVGELVPKAVAVRNAEGIGLLVARPIEVAMRLSGPVVHALTRSSRIVLKLFGWSGEVQPSFLTIEDLRAIVREAESQGMLADGVLRGAVEFHERDVREVLTPINRVAAVPVAAGLRAAARVAMDSGHSRIPVFEGSLDNTIGMVFSRQVFEALLTETPRDLKDLLRPVAIVPWTKPATRLLAEMRHTGSQMAMVVDEHGAVRGLVTLEDLVEVIVGDIRDEHAPEAESVRIVGPGTLEVEGSVSVRELNADHGVGLPEASDYVTLAGLILQRVGAIPSVGQVLDVDGARITVLALEGRRVARLRVERAEIPEPVPDR